MEDLANFARLVEAIRPWLAYVVIAGGWATDSRLRDLWISLLRHVTGIK